jgi:predicted amidophosphoribosyltransferase
VKSLKEVVNSLVHLTYPPFCLHCQQELQKTSEKFCPTCVELLQLIDPTTRCKGCFKERPCISCRTSRPLIEGVASCFDPFGPSRDFVSHLKKNGHPEQMEVAASFLTLQLLNLKWPFPDVVVPMPSHPISLLFGQRNLAKELAISFAKLIDRAVLSPLKKGREISSKDEGRLDKKRVLVIDLEKIGEEELCQGAQAIYSQGSKEVFALTLL